MAPKKTCKLYYGNEPGKDTVAVTRWVGWGYLCQATSFALMDKYGDANMKKAAKKMMTAANAYAIAQHKGLQLETMSKALFRGLF